MVKFHTAFDTELIRLIGIVAIEAAMMDVFVGLTLAKLTGTEMDVGRNALFAQDTRKKLERLQKLDLPDDLKAATAAIPHILADRALLIHGLAGWDADLREAMHLAMRGRYRDKPQKMDTARAQRLVEAIEAVNDVLMKHNGAADSMQPIVGKPPAPFGR